MIEPSVERGRPARIVTLLIPVGLLIFAALRLEPLAFSERSPRQSYRSVHLGHHPASKPVSAQLVRTVAMDSVAMHLPTRLTDDDDGSARKATEDVQDSEVRKRWFGFWEGGDRPMSPPMSPPPSPPPPLLPFDPDAKVIFTDALHMRNGWKLTNIVLDADCKTNWVLNSAASTTAVLVRDAINYIKMPLHLSDFLPGDSELRLTTATGTHVFLDNVTIVKIDPSYVQYGFCWDDLEWFERQDLGTQLKSDIIEGRIKPDRLMVIASKIEAHVTFDYSLWQDVLFGNIPLGGGMAELVVQGFIGLDVDLHNIGEAGITDCAGYFGFDSLDVGIDGAEDLSFDHEVLSAIMPILAEQMDSIICYGDGLASISLYDSETGKGEKFEGIVNEINDILHSNLGFVRFLQSGETAAERKAQAVQDQAHLASIGIYKPLGEGRFSMIEGVEYVQTNDAVIYMSQQANIAAKGAADWMS